MPDRIDLDEVMRTLAAGRWPDREVVMAMRDELCAWRAAHHGGAVVVAKMRATQEPIAIAALEAYRACVEGVMATLGYPQVGDTAKQPSGGDV